VNSGLPTYILRYVFKSQNRVSGTPEGHHFFMLFLLLNFLKSGSHLNRRTVKEYLSQDVYCKPQLLYITQYKNIDTSIVHMTENMGQPEADSKKKEFLSAACSPDETWEAFGSAAPTFPKSKKDNSERRAPSALAAIRNSSAIIKSAIAINESVSGRNPKVSSKPMSMRMRISSACSDVGDQSLNTGSTHSATGRSNRSSSNAKPKSARISSACSDDVGDQSLNIGSTHSASGRSNRSSSNAKPKSARISSACADEGDQSLNIGSTHSASGRSRRSSGNAKPKSARISSACSEELSKELPNNDRKGRKPSSSRNSLAVSNDPKKTPGNLLSASKPSKKGGQSVACASVIQSNYSSSKGLGNIATNEKEEQHQSSDIAEPAPAPEPAPEEDTSKHDGRGSMPKGTNSERTLSLTKDLSSSRSLLAKSLAMERKASARRVLSEELMETEQEGFRGTLAEKKKKATAKSYSERIAEAHEQRHKEKQAQSRHFDVVDNTKDVEPPASKKGNASFRGRRKAKKADTQDAPKLAGLWGGSTKDNDQTSQIPIFIPTGPGPVVRLLQKTKAGLGSLRSFRRSADDGGNETESSKPKVGGEDGEAASEVADVSDSRQTPSEGRKRGGAMKNALVRMTSFLNFGDDAWDDNPDDNLPVTKSTLNQPKMDQKIDDGNGTIDEDANKTDKRGARKVGSPSRSRDRKGGKVDGGRRGTKDIVSVAATIRKDEEEVKDEIGAKVTVRSTKTSIKSKAATTNVVPSAKIADSKKGKSNGKEWDSDSDDDAEDAQGATLAPKPVTQSKKRDTTSKPKSERIRSKATLKENVYNATSSKKPQSERLRSSKPSKTGF
jgi:hypothetical protein